MKGRLCALLVRLFPCAWRLRFGNEFLAVLEAQPLTPALLFDVLRAALDAHFHPQGWTRRSRLERLRNIQLNLFLLFTLFAGTTLFLFKQSEHSFDGLTRTHPEISYLASFVALGWAAACSVVGWAGVPWLWRGLRSALKRRADVWLYSVPALLVTSFALVTVLLLKASAAHELPHVLQTVWKTHLGVTVVLSAVLLTTALRRSALEPTVLRRPLSLDRCLKSSMVGLSLATLAWGFSIWHASPGAFYQAGFREVFQVAILIMMVTTGITLVYKNRPL